MYRGRSERVSRLRRFVARRGKGRAGDLASLIAEATRLMLLPSLRDVLNDQASEPMELRLTYACACVVLAELLAQRFAPRQADEAAAGAIRQIGAWSGLDDARLNARASASIVQLTETHPEVHQALCGQFDDAVQRSIVLGRPAQGEVMLRLALESLEAAIQHLVLGREGAEATEGLIRSSGLLRVVTRRATAPQPPDARAPAWPFAQLEQLTRLYRPARRVAPARSRVVAKRSEERASRQRRRLGALTGLVDRWRREGDDPRPDKPSK